MIALTSNIKVCKKDIAWDIPFHTHVISTNFNIPSYKTLKKHQNNFKRSHGDHGRPMVHPWGCKA